MKNFYNVMLNMFDGKEWHELFTFSDNITYAEPTDLVDDVIFYPTFTSLYEAIESSFPRHFGVRKDVSFFTKTPYVNFSINVDADIKITEKNFATYPAIALKFTYTKIKPTMKRLYNEVSADTLLEYLKDHGISLNINNL